LDFLLGGPSPEIPELLELLLPPELVLGAFGQGEPSNHHNGDDYDGDDKNDGSLMSAPK